VRVERVVWLGSGFDVKPWQPMHMVRRRLQIQKHAWLYPNHRVENLVQCRTDSLLPFSRAPNQNGRVHV
jgi:hypothetical protein